MTKRDPFYAPRIDEEIWAFIDRTDSFYPPDTVDADIATQRAVYDEMCAAFRQKRPSGLSVRDESIPGGDGEIPIRRYQPHATAEPAAIVIYCHGGGFVVGGLESHDDVCAEIAAATGFSVVSVDYRLCPEHRHPAAYNDVLAAFEAISKEGNPIILCGDSAGGNLAAAVCLAIRHRPDAPAGQVLIYPGLGGEIMGLPSYREEAHAPLLTTRDVMFYKNVRVEGEVPGNDPTYAPLSARDFTGAAPCVIVTADCDPLRDDGATYVKRLRDAGVEAEWINEPGLVHGYLRARTSSERAKHSFARICDAIARLGAAAGR
ncbi:alpha/beta hydrolase [Denitrobaculum tricleocarpae]|uniref:Alpha/beta hydrolase n=1 Tax=Denitrobaculum tricleocarpae TaxID=2591009 RepID=A0A545TEX7_9PROT|nr:alpha/beta hydrolase [Denitrobaculum tricleocarpae]TQV75787.1 alpha/beta hydrolase [Denitrobaculum tricleocarpae]